MRVFGKSVLICITIWTMAAAAYAQVPNWTKELISTGLPVEAAASGPLGSVWAYASFGQSMGRSGIVVADNGTTKEVYLGGSLTASGENDYWYALRYQATGYAGLTPFFASPTFGSKIRRIAVGNVVGSSQQILVALQDGRVIIYDQPSKLRLGQINTAAATLRNMAVADVDGDGKQDILVCTTTQLWVYGGNGTLKWTSPGSGGLDLEVAQMDADPAMEIALGGGRVLDAATRTVQFELPGGFGDNLEVADIDSDGKAELIASNVYTITAYDVDLQSEKWSITPVFVGKIAVADVNGDSVYDLLTGDSQFGNITSYNTVTREIQWFIPNPLSGVSYIAAADVDSDGTKEVLWGAGSSSTGPQHLYIGNPAGSIEWENFQLEGPYVGPKLGDLDGDGIQEIVTASYSSDSGSKSGRILVFDQTLTLKAISPPVAQGGSFLRIRDLVLQDVDGDGQQEVLIATSYSSDGVVEIYDLAGTVLTLQWTNNLIRPFGEPFQALAAADLDGDGNLEIIAGSAKETSGSVGSIYVYDYATLTEEWVSPGLGGIAPSALRVADIDHDGNLEIVAVTGSGSLVAFDGKTKNLDAQVDGTYTAVEFLGPYPLVVLGDTGGNLSAFVFYGPDHSEVFNANFVTQAVDGFTIGPLGSLWIGSGGTLKALGSTGVVWESQPYFSTQLPPQRKVYGRHVEQLPGQPAIFSAGPYSVNLFALVGSGATEGPTLGQ